MWRRPCLGRLGRVKGNDLPLAGGAHVHLREQPHVLDTDAGHLAGAHQPTADQCRVSVDTHAQIRRVITVEPRTRRQRHLHRFGTTTTRSAAHSRSRACTSPRMCAWFHTDSSAVSAETSTTSCAGFACSIAATSMGIANVMLGVYAVIRNSKCKIQNANAALLR